MQRPAGEIRLVLTDADGTLLNGEHRVSDHTRAVVARVEARGVPVVVATGRPPSMAAQVIDQAGTGHYAICSNGAVTLDLGLADPYADPMALCSVDPEPLRRLVTSLRERHDGLIFSLEIDGGIVQEPGFQSHMGPVDPGPTTDVPDILDAITTKVQKLLVINPQVPAGEMIPIVDEFLGPQLETTRSGLAAAEIMPVGISKASAAESLCAQLGIDRSEVVAFGDEVNDLEMLRWAGTAVAMANAGPEVQAAADHQTESHLEDGVARWLERNIL